MNGILKGLDTTAKVKALMSARGLTQPDLAAVLGVSLGTIGNRFESHRWLISELRKIADTYDVNIKDLI